MALNRTHVGIVLVALLTVVAGCSGGGDGGSGPTATPADAATGSTTTDGGGGNLATRTATPTRTDTGGATPSGGGQSGVAKYIGNQGRLLQERGGYVAEISFSTEKSGKTMSISGTVKHNFEKDERLVSYSQNGGKSAVSVVEYKPPGNDTIHTCVIRNDECTRQQTRPAASGGLPNTTAPFANAQLDRLPNFSDEGVVETEQGRLRKFVVDSVDDLATETTNGLTYEEFHMELYFEPDSKVLRKFVLETTVSSQRGTSTVRYTITYTEVGAVPIQPPDWYDG